MVRRSVALLSLFVSCLWGASPNSLESEVAALKTELQEVKLILSYLMEGNSVEAVLPEAKMRLNEIAKQKAIHDSLMALHYDIPIGNSPVLGPDSAKVTIVEFADFECPHCFRTSQELERLVTDFPNQIRVIFKHYPLDTHPNALGAHRASLAAVKLGRFWEYRFLLPYKYDQLNPKVLLKGATLAGMKKRAFRKALETIDTTQITEDRTMGTILSVDGTPTFFINGKRYPHFSYEQIIKDFNLLPRESAVQDSSCNCELDD